MRLFAGRTSQTDEPFEHHFFYWSSRSLDLVPRGRTPKHYAGHSQTPTRLRRRRRYPYPQATAAITHRHYDGCSQIKTIYFRHFGHKSITAKHACRAQALVLDAANSQPDVPGDPARRYDVALANRPENIRQWRVPPTPEASHLSRDRSAPSQLKPNSPA